MNSDLEPAGLSNFGVGVGEGNDTLELLTIHIINILKDQRSSIIKKLI